MSSGGKDAVQRPAASFEETLRQILRDVVRLELRAIVREELAAALASVPTRPQPEEAQHYLTPKAAAEIAKVSEKTIRRWVQSGQLGASQLGRIVRIKRSDLDAFMEAGGGRRRSTLTADEIALAVLRRKRR